jgi:ribosomal-protein-alanine N-acetyltransferase
MEIETSRLVLITITDEDIGYIHKLHSIPEVDRYNTLGIPVNLEETRKLVEPVIAAQEISPRKDYTFKIVLKESKEYIGLAGITLSLDKFRLGEIYFKLAPAYWGKGYATEVSKMLIETGFEVLKLHKVEAGADTENAASIHVLEKSGMVREGLRRKILPIRGEWRDGYLYAITEDDPR